MIFMPIKSRMFYYLMKEHGNKFKYVSLEKLFNILNEVFQDRQIVATVDKIVKNVSVFNNIEEALEELNIDKKQFNKNYIAVQHRKHVIVINKEITK